jgi:hypothetical protein
MCLDGLACWMETLDESACEFKDRDSRRRKYYFYSCLNKHLVCQKIKHLIILQT